MRPFFQKRKTSESCIISIHDGVRIKWARGNRIEQAGEAAGE